MIHECAVADCLTLTMGQICLDHELERQRLRAVDSSPRSRGDSYQEVGNLERVQRGAFAQVVAGDEEH